MEQFQDPYGILELMAVKHNQEEDEGSNQADSYVINQKDRPRSRSVIKKIFPEPECYPSSISTK